MNEAHSNLPTCDLLNTLLEKRIEHPEQAVEIERDIRKSYEQEKTIFVLDMSGFSRIVQRYGIIHYLAMIRRMQKVVKPAVEKNGGTVIKFEADNCFVVFGTPDGAVQASRDIHHDLNVANILTADESDVHVSIGIGHGTVLLACDDMYGNELNLASKLGEDVAERDEVLLTEAAKNKITLADARFEEFPLTVSGVTMKAFRLLIA